MLKIYLRTKLSVQHYVIDHCSLSSVKGIQREIKVKGHKLGTVANFKCFGTDVSHYGFKTRSCFKDCTRKCGSNKVDWDLIGSVSGVFPTYFYSNKVESTL